MNQSTDYLYSELTGTVIGCAMNVHNELGKGFRETIYQRALQIELRAAKLSYKTELERNVTYKGIVIGKRRLDLLVEGKVLVELKVLPEIVTRNYSQMLNYLNIFKVEVGLVLNFGCSKLEFKRFVLSKK
jgi:GxxExxY protein